MTSSTMTAIAVDGGKGPADALKPVQIPVPTPGEGQILVKVAAAGVNRPDILQRQGAYPPPPGAPDTLGLEIAGEVVQGAGRWKAGDKVCALLGGGGYAQYAVVDARHALPIPAGLSLVEAAGRDITEGIDRLIGAADHFVGEGFHGAAWLLIEAVAKDVNDDRALLIISRD